MSTLIRLSKMVGIGLLVATMGAGVASAADDTQDLQTVFDQIDTDNSGFLSPAEGGRFMQLLAEYNGTPVGDEEMDQLGKQFVSDCEAADNKADDGKVSFDEFVAMIRLGQQ